VDNFYVLDIAAKESRKNLDCERKSVSKEIGGKGLATELEQLVLATVSCYYLKIYKTASHFYTQQCTLLFTRIQGISLFSSLLSERQVSILTHRMLLSLEKT
jgi:hypothetical protein